MKQWAEIRESLDDSIIVFCRVGDFFELFYDDAELVSEVLDLQVSKRKIGNGTYPMAGVPYRSIETYVARLINKGFKVAIIDQLEDAKQARGKKTVARGLTRIISKGTLTEENMLTPSKNNYLGSIYHKRNKKTVEIGFAVCDLSTGDFRAGNFAYKDRNDLLRAFIKFSPVELIHLDSMDEISSFYGISLDNDELMTGKPDLWFDYELAKETIFHQFGVDTTQGYGFNENSPASSACGALLRYLKETQFGNFPHITGIKSFDISDTMTLDSTAIRGLELFQNAHDHTSNASFLELMDETITPMGGRLIRSWIANPLAQKKKIDERLEVVELFWSNEILLHETRSLFSEIGDIERLITRISMGSARPDELQKLSSSLKVLPVLLQKLETFHDHFPVDLIKAIDPCTDVVDFIDKTLVSDSSNTVGSGLVIKVGYNTELDRLSKILKEGKNWLDLYLDREKKDTQIESMKIRQNNHFGYFLEVSKRELSKIPDYFVRKQAMVNATRYITDELKGWEIDIIDAEINIFELESNLYKSILQSISEHIDILQTTSTAISQLDCLSSFSFLAERRNYQKPVINEDRGYKVIGARHPVIEALNQDQDYVPNDIMMDYEQDRLLIITGPNFSGKSSLLRATALIAIMAQMGSFVPAESAELGVIDRIFTRIGASDNLVAGQSTFMLEMVDAANLVNNSTDRSLIIADELGRGTSTYDGLAIAWSIAEFLHNSENSPKTMIATHYHQLAELEELLKSCVNYQFIIRFEGDKPIFDHKLHRGSSDKSFGVEVAKLSGLPEMVIDRARQILQILESKAAKVDEGDSEGPRLVDLIIQEDGQTSLDNWFGGLSIADAKPSVHNSKVKNSNKIIAKIRSLKLENLSSDDALIILRELKQDVV